MADNHDASGDGVADLPPLPDAIGPATPGTDHAPIDPDLEAMEASKAPLLDHLIELRRRLLWSLGAIVVAFFVCYYFAEQIFGFLLQPYLAAGEEQLIYSELFAAFFVQIKVALFAAMMIAFPVIATQIWRFIAPGLYRNEKRALLPFLLATPVLFGMGAAMAYYFVMPLALNFVLGFQQDIGGVRQEALISVTNYLDFVMHFMLAFGVAFLLPILLMLLERSGIVTLEGLRSSRRYMIVAAFAVAAVLTPPDPGSMLLLAIPLTLLFELSLLAISFTAKRRAIDNAP